jgi:surface antigen
MRKIFTLLLIGILLIATAGIIICKTEKAQVLLGKMATGYEVSDAVDSLHGVPVYYNGAVAHTGERHLAADGYNYGLRWQCVEFVKRYYHDYLNHKMPDTYGHAKDFFNPALADGELNKARKLLQYSANSKTTPKVNDLLVFGATSFNQYGHVAIVAKADTNEIEMIQQNPGPTAPSRVVYMVLHKNGKYTIDRSDLLGWLRKE